MNKQILNLAFLGVLLALFAFTQVMPISKDAVKRQTKNDRVVCGSYSAKMMDFHHKNK